MDSSFKRFLHHTHNDAPQSVGLLWTSDQPDAETSIWQHTTLTTDRRPCPRWAPQSVGLLWTSDQLVAETSTWQHSQQTSMLPVGFEPTTSAGERLQTYALDRAATGTGRSFQYSYKLFIISDSYKDSYLATAKFPSISYFYCVDVHALKGSWRRHSNHLNV